MLAAVLARVAAAKPGDLELVICDLSASPFMDLAGSAMLHKLHAELTARNISLRVVGARGRVRELLRRDRLDHKVGAIERGQSLSECLTKWAGKADRPERQIES